MATVAICGAVESVAVNRAIKNVLEKDQYKIQYIAIDKQQICI